MRIALALAVNVAVAAAAILVYDTMRSDGAPAQTPGSGADVSALEARLAALESRLGGLSSQRTDRSVAARLAEIEARIAAPAAAPDAGAGSGKPAAAPSDDPAAIDGIEPLTSAADPNAPVTDAEVARFRRLQERVDADRERDRIAASLDGILARLNLQLTQAQKERLATETVTFRGKLREIFPGGGPGMGGGMGGGPGMMGGAGGRPPEETFAAVRELQASYTSKLEEFLPASDAAAIAASIAPAPRMPGQGRGPGGDGGPPSR